MAHTLGAIMKIILAVLLMLTSLSASALDVSNANTKTVGTKKKTTTLVIGQRLTKSIRAEVDAGITLSQAKDPNAHSTFGVSFEYAFKEEAKYSLNIKSGIHYDANLITASVNQYSTLGLSYKRQLSKNSYHVIEVSRKLQKTDQWRTGEGFRLTTGVRYEF
jgi:hypothetical protein